MFQELVHASPSVRLWPAPIARPRQREAADMANFRGAHIKADNIGQRYRGATTNALEGISFTISDEKKPGIYSRMRGLARTDSLPALLGGTIVLAAGGEVSDIVRLTWFVTDARDYLDRQAEVGATVTCELTADGQTLPVTATVTSVEGSTVNFDIQVADS